MPAIHFNINGETITELARSYLYEKYDLDKAITFLMESLISDEISNETRFQYALDILQGRKKLVGMYPDGDYHLEDAEDDVPGISKLIKTLAEKAQTATKQMETYQMHRNFLICQLTEHTPYTAKDYINAYKDEFEEDMLTDEEKETFGLPVTRAISNPMVQSFLDRMTSETEDDYGWLEPNGTFHPVEWSDHQEWARTYLETHIPDIDSAQLLYPGDYLIEHHWILLHNPAQGIAHVTIHDTFTPTKNQKDFLYDYYTERNQPKLATQWLES